MLGGNPAYDAPADLKFAELLRSAKVPLKIHLGSHQDETAGLCQWHVPEAHALESWGDVRGFDGTATIQQPLIAPLYGGKSAIELLSVLWASPTDRRWRSSATTGGGSRCRATSRRPGGTPCARA